jgi:acetyl esterase
MPKDTFDPQIIEARRRQAASVQVVDITSLPPAEGRAFANKAALFFNDGGPSVARVASLTVPGATAEIRARLYRPSRDRVGAVLFLHGGGWFHCNVDTHDRLMRVLARDSGLAVLGVDYRLAPEHPYPAGLEDAISAWRWMGENAERLNLDPKKMGVAGDSAGANIALAMTLAERDAGHAMPQAAALFYGCYAPDFETESHRNYGDGRFGLTTARMRWYWENYAGKALMNAAVLATPLHANFTGLPATYLALADLDPLADDTRILAGRLDAAGVPHVLKQWRGAGHGFLQMTRDVELARHAAGDAARFLSDTLG